MRVMSYFVRLWLLASLTFHDWDSRDSPAARRLHAGGTAAVVFDGDFCGPAERVEIDPQVVR
jgi:hypothetical protein